MFEITDDIMNLVHETEINSLIDFILDKELYEYIDDINYGLCPRSIAPLIKLYKLDAPNPDRLPDEEKLKSLFTEGINRIKTFI